MSDPNIVKEPKDAHSDPRTAVRRCGGLTRTKGEQLLECVVWDESRTGARLVFDAPGVIFDTGLHLAPALPGGMAFGQANRG
jgi:hypothetical protein